MRVRIKKDTLRAWPIEEHEIWKTFNDTERAKHIGAFVVEHLRVGDQLPVINIWKKEDFDKEYEVIRSGFGSFDILDSVEEKLKDPAQRAVLCGYAATYLRDSERTGQRHSPASLEAIRMILLACREGVPCASSLP